MTGMDLNQLIATKANTSPELLRLLKDGKEILETHKLAEHNVTNGTVIHFIEQNLAGG